MENIFKNMNDNYKLFCHQKPILFLIFNQYVKH